MTENTNTLKIEKITPKPPKHEAVLLTEDNYLEVAQWLGSETRDVKFEQWGDTEPVITFKLFPKSGIFYGMPEVELIVNPGLYIIKPARNYDGSQDEPFALGAVAYDKFFKKAR